LLVAEIAEGLHRKAGHVFLLKRKQKRSNAGDHDAVVRDARWNDGGEIWNIGKLERGGEKFDIGRIDLAERSRTGIGDDLKREVAAIHGCDEFDILSFSFIEDGFDRRDFAIANP
jgi:hypothetical protein